ncbi:hypothetical protein ACP70R_030464 [Stipagrostis hirtigluma subsp. patula]
MSTLQLDSSNNNGAAATIVMDAISEVLGSAGDHPDVVGAWKQLRLTRLLFLAGFLTLVMDLATALYKPPGGVVFQRHRLAYYLTLAGIFAAGVAEVSAAFWLSRYGQARGRPFARAVLCASVVPLVVVTALGGFSVLMKC